MQWGIPKLQIVTKDFYMLNKMKIMLAGTIVAASLVSGAANAATETATAQAEILTPVALSAVSDLNFGLIATSGTAGTVVIPTTSDVRDCTDVICVGTASRASFQVTAATDGQLVNLGITDNTITLVDGANSMTATLGLSSASIVFDPLALETVYVGGTLDIGATQAAGQYTGSFEVTADYP
jgi:Mat/Ecp fimbriae major subunit